jgi:predicted deacylase
MAIDADIVLDLHCDNEAVLHIYAGTPLATRHRAAGALLGAHALLLAPRAAGPFDEACSRLWWDLAEHFGPIRRSRRPAPRPRWNCAAKWTCATTTRAGCAGLLQLPGAARACSTCPPSPMPAPLCAPDAAGRRGARCDAPHAGVLVFLKRAGRTPEGRRRRSPTSSIRSPARPTVLRCSVDGVFARTAHRHLLRGMQVCKIAGAGLSVPGTC